MARSRATQPTEPLRAVRRKRRERARGWRDEGGRAPSSPRRGGAPFEGARRSRAPHPRTRKQKERARGRSAARTRAVVLARQFFHPSGYRPPRNSLSCFCSALVLVCFCMVRRPARRADRLRSRRRSFGSFGSSHSRRFDRTAVDARHVDQREGALRDDDQSLVAWRGPGPQVRQCADARVAGHAARGRAAAAAARRRERPRGDAGESPRAVLVRLFVCFCLATRRCRTSRRARFCSSFSGHAARCRRGRTPFSGFVLFLFGDHARPVHA